MIKVEYSNEEAQLVASLLNTHKNNHNKLMEIASSALEKVIKASNQETQDNAKGEQGST